MGAVDFDPDRWLAEHAASDGAKAAKLATVQRAEAAALAGVAALADPVLPASVVMGLRRLAGPVPRRVADLAVWAEVAADARRLADEGWAATALTLGWSVLDLWGHSLSHDGLAVWLRGRKLVLVDEQTAIAASGPSARAQFTRCRQGMSGAKLLWELN